MKYITKIFVAIVLLAVVTMSFVGCGKRAKIEQFFNKVDHATAKVEKAKDGNGDLLEALQGIVEVTTEYEEIRLTDEWTEEDDERYYNEISDY